MSGNSFPAVAPPIVSGLPNWFARTAKTAESGFNNDLICFWGDSTTATALNLFGATPQPVTYPTFGSARLVNVHQKTGGALANTRIVNFGNTGATLAVSLQQPSAAVFNVTRVISASQQIFWPAANPPAAGDTVTIGGTVWTFIAAGATPTGNQVALGTSGGGSISNLVAALQAATDAPTAQNNYASRASAYDAGVALDIWSKRTGAAGAGQTIACSSAGAAINGNPVLSVPGLVVLCYGINDVRTGTTTQAQLVALITQAVNRIRAALPGTDIVLWGPNSFLADDPTSAGLVTPNSSAAVTAASAQAYSTLLYGAYEQLRNVWPNVLVIQKQDLFGKACQTYAGLGGANGAMSDQLHPSLTGQTQMADWIAPLIGFQKPFNQQRANLARLGNPTAPYTIYNREVEDPAYYSTVIQGQWLGQGTVSSNDYLDITAPGARYKEILPGDIVQMGFAGPVWQIPFTAQLYNLNTNTIRIGSLGTGLLPVISGGPITVTRNRFEWDATIQSYASQANAYPYARRFYCPAAGSGYFRLYPLAQNSRDPANMLLNPNTDVIVPPGGFGAITGYTTLPFSTAGTWQVSLSGTDFTALAGKYVWVFSTTPARDQMENVFDPIRLDITGAISATYFRKICTRGGKINKVLYTQGTASTSANLTITLKANGTQVVSFLVTANHTAISTTTWASGTSFWTYPGWVLEWSISGGAGAADISIVLDIANT